MRKYLFLLGAHKSGTSLLRSLLDSHPALTVLPIETHFLELMGLNISYKLRERQFSDFDPVEFQRAAVRLVEEYNNSISFTSDSNLRGRFDIQKFKCEMADAKELKACIDRYFHAIIKALGGEDIEDNKIVVEKSVEHSLFAPLLKLLFPNAKFVHIVRNPYANLVSLRKFKSGKNFPSLYELLVSLEDSYNASFNNNALLDDYLVIRYENLITQTSATIDKLCNHLGIDKHTSLNEPSLLGEPWQGNSTRAVKYRGVSNSGLEAWKEEITPLECYYVNNMFGDVVRNYQYDTYAVDQSFWKINRHENIKTYIRNRFYRIYL